MKISIITIAFNAESTIRQAFESIYAQKNIELEHIVIDGGSSDSTVEIISSYGSRVSWLVSEEDEGIYDAMNKGLRLATGEVIGILNADDMYCHPYVLSMVAEQFQEAGLEAVFGDLGYFRAGAPSKIVRKYRSRGFTSKQLSRGIMPAHPTLFLRSSIYKRFGLFDPSYKIAGDFEFVARIFCGDKINFRYLPEMMVRMQMGGASTSGLRSNWILLQENLRACKKNGIPTNFFRLISRYPRKLLEYLF